jgi:hypothetical protein
MEGSKLLFVLGLLVIIISLLVQIRKRYKNEAKRKREKYEAIIAAGKEKQNELIQKGEDPKRKPGTSEISRVPIGEPFKDKFNGHVAQNQISKWEAEMFTLGRQLIGQIDSKMIAIETLTLEANHTANRLELLIEHFEQLTHKLEINGKNKPIAQTPPNHNSQKNKPQTANFNDYLNELETEIDDFQDKVDELDEAKEVTILSATSDLNSAPIEPTKNNDPFALSSPKFPGDNVTENIRTNIPANVRTNNHRAGLSIDSLFRESSKHSAISTSTNNDFTNNITPQNRKQIEMLANYGFNTKEIAQKLNITTREVDSILNVKK